jgi:hypothetical protein
VAGLVRQRALQPPLLGDVAEHHHGADDLGVAITDRRRRVLDLDLLAEPVLQHAVFGKVHQLALAQAAHQRILQFTVRQLVQQPQHRAEFLAARLIAAPAESCSATGFM